MFTLKATKLVFLQMAMLLAVGSAQAATTCLSCLNLKLPPAREAEIVEEVAQHLEDRYQELVAGGATEAEARRSRLRTGPESETRPSRPTPPRFEANTVPRNLLAVAYGADLPTIRLQATSALHRRPHTSATVR